MHLPSPAFVRQVELSEKKKDKTLEEQSFKSSRNVRKQLSSDDASYRRTDDPWRIRWTEHIKRMAKTKNM